MTAKLELPQPENQTKNIKLQSGSSETVYGLGLIGAWVYYISRATNFREGVIGFFKGIVWPAILVYELLKLLEKNEPD
jgi:hypothetical protein